MKLELKDVTKRFPSRDKNVKKENVAVANFSYEFPDGKLVALLGPSGCGKSTTLNMISGLEAPTEGRVFFGEDDVTDLPPEKRGIGLVFQNYALYPHLTVLQNIMFPLENLKGAEKLSKDVMKEKALAAAKLVQIEKYLSRKPSQLSGGQQQRVAIARALVKMPKVLLLDEPLSNLDARLRLQTREEIRRIQQETKITTVFVTHDQDEAMSIADYIVVMEDGHIRQTGEPQAVYDSPENLFVAKFLGVPPINVFTGKIENGQVFIGSEAVLKTDAKDQDVYIAIRPEGFLVEADGALHCKLNNIEVMGRDTSIIASHENSEQETFRAIVMAEYAPTKGSETVNLNLKTNKVFLFDKETEERIHCVLEK